MVDFIVRAFVEKDEKDATDKNVDYFVNFCDPTEPERQMGVVLHAIWHVVLIQRRRDHEQRQTTIGGVHDFVLDRCKESPQDFALYILMKSWEIAILYRKAERTNDIDLYFTCMRMSLPILATGHAVKYVRVFTDVLRYWTTCSDHERFLIRKYGFTMQTPMGFFIGIDWGQEKCVKLVRDVTGKVQRRGGQARAENAAMTRIGKLDTGIKEQKPATSEIKENQGEGYSYVSSVVRSAPQDFRVFIKTVNLLLSVGAFSANPADHVMEPDTNKFTSIRSLGAELDPRYLRFWSQIGTPRVDSYILNFQIKTQNMVIRSEKEDEGGVNMAKIKSSSTKVAKSKEQRISLAVATRNKELNGFTEVELFAELKRVETNLLRSQKRAFPELTRDSNRALLV
jgi:hypothetical protein